MCRHLAEYEGVTEQVVMMRVAQNEALGVHAYEPIFG